MRTKKLISFISIILCVCIILGTGVSARAETKVYSSASAAYTETNNNIFQTLAETIFSALVSAFTDHESTPDGIGETAIVRFPFIIAPFQENPGYFNGIKKWLLVGTKVKILDYSGEKFAYVQTRVTEEKGYIHNIFLDDNESGTLSINREYDHVNVAGNNKDKITGQPRTQATYNGHNKVSYSTEDTDIISVNSETGLITGKKAGTATLIVTAGIHRKECTVYCISPWKSKWTGKSNKSTTIYSGTSTSSKALKTISSNTLFTVEGDDGGSAGWAYGSSDGCWGFVRIEDISTKNTVSFYKGLNIGYPIADETLKYISSPYAKRSSSDLHRGFDITGGGTYIYGKTLVAPFNGKVVFVNKYCYNNNESPSYGYCITIESNGGDSPETELTDSVTGKHFTATYMHLSEAPGFYVGDTVKKGEPIGKIGNTGNVDGSPGVNPIGTHLHFEINNMTAVIGSSNYELRTDFTYNINPIYFYMNRDFSFNTGSSSYKTYGAYWYGPNN